MWVDAPKSIYLKMSPPFLSLCPLSQGPGTNSLEHRWFLRGPGLIALVWVWAPRSVGTFVSTESPTLRRRLQRRHTGLGIFRGCDKAAHVLCVYVAPYEAAVSAV